MPEINCPHTNATVTKRVCLHLLADADTDYHQRFTGVGLTYDLICADIRSPRTIGTLRANPACEVNVVDPIARKGYRFKGRAEVIGDGPGFERMVAFFRQRGTTSPIRHVVLIAVKRALPVISPGYDGGASEDEIHARWRHYYAGLREEEGVDDAPSD